MSGCVLRAASPSLAPSEFLKAHPALEASHCDNAINVVVSDKDGDDLPGQVHDAIAFLQAHRSAVQALCTAAGGATLDFGLWRKDTVSQSILFPPALVAAAGELGLGLEASVYDAAP